MEVTKYGLEIKFDDYEKIALRKMIKHIAKMKYPKSQDIESLFLNKNEVIINQNMIELLSDLVGYCQNGMEQDEQVIKLWYKLSNLHNLLLNISTVDKCGDRNISIVPLSF